MPELPTISYSSIISPENPLAQIIDPVLSLGQSAVQTVPVIVGVGVSTVQGAAAVTTRAATYLPFVPNSVSIPFPQPPSPPDPYNAPTLTQTIVDPALNTLAQATASTNLYTPEGRQNLSSSLRIHQANIPGTSRLGAFGSLINTLATVPNTLVRGSLGAAGSIAGTGVATVTQAARGVVGGVVSQLPGNGIAGNVINTLPITRTATGLASRTVNSAINTAASGPAAALQIGSQNRTLPFNAGLGLSNTDLQATIALLQSAGSIASVGTGESLLGPDKLLHAGGSAALAALGYTGARALGATAETARLVGAGGSLFFGLGKEFTDFGNGTPSFVDIYANIYGIGGALGVANAGENFAGALASREAARIANKIKADAERKTAELKARGLELLRNFGPQPVTPNSSFSNPTPPSTNTTNPTNRITPRFNPDIKGAQRLIGRGY